MTLIEAFGRFVIQKRQNNIFAEKFRLLIPISYQAF